MSTSATKHADDELIQLDEPLKEYVRLIASLKSAMQRRQDKKIAYVNAITDLENKQSALQKAKDDQMATKQVAVEKAQATADSAKESYETVTKEMVDDFERFKAQKAQDIKEILLNFVNAQIMYNRRSEETWAGLLSVVQGMSAPPAASSSSSSSANPFADDAPPAFAPPRPPVSGSSGGYETFSNHSNYISPPAQHPHSAKHHHDDDEDLVGV